MQGNSTSCSVAAVYGVLDSVSLDLWAPRRNHREEKPTESPANVGKLEGYILFTMNLKALWEDRNISVLLQQDN